MTRTVLLALPLLLTACSGGDGDGTGSTAEAAADIDGAVFELNVTGLTTPNADPDLATIVGLFFSAPVWLHTTNQTESGLDVTMGFGLSGGGQDSCAPTSSFPSASLSGSGFTFGPSDTTFYTTTTSFEVLDLSGEGTINADGDALTGLQLQGLVDLRQAVGFAGFDDVDNLCTTFGNLGLDCGDCGDGSATCVELELASLSASLVDGASFEVISPSQAAANCPTI